MIKKILLLGTLVAFVTSCGNKKKEVEQESTAVQEEVKVETPQETEASQEASVTTNGDGTIVVIGSTDQMTFNTKEIRVKAGTKVRLTLKHLGNLPKSAMGHNFVLLKKGTDVKKFAEKAMEAGAELNYIPRMTKDVIANTNVIGGGESTEITFNAPEAGVYDFICSFPAHYATMSGKFIVE